MSQSYQDSAGQCPPGITWNNRIEALFQPYVECMIGQGINLGKYNGTDGDSVVENIDDIKSAIDNGSMPRGEQYKQMWTAANGTFYFDCWYDQGYPEGTTAQTGSADALGDVTFQAGANGGSITWTNTMKAVFAPYVQCMVNQGIDLSKYNGTDGDSVVENISDIQAAIDNGSMPRGASYQATWKAANGKSLFDQWYAAGYPQ